MAKITIKIDGQPIECPEGITILEAADLAEIYIPRLCYHPDLPPTCNVVWDKSVFQADKKITGEKSGEKAGEEAHCNLCLVEVEGHPEALNSCVTSVKTGMVVHTGTEEIIRLRKHALSKLLADHPHACLTCAQKEGCSRTDCSTNVPVNERCCILLGRCELEKVSDYIGIPGDTPKYIPKKYPVFLNDPLFDRDYNLCIGCLRCMRVCREVRGVNVLGAVWKGSRVWVGTLSGAGLRETDCRFCGACVEVCPTGAMLDKENAPAVRKDVPVPCVRECPAGIDIPRYVRLIASGRDGEALDLIRSRVPFPGILGYVCFHPCEEICRRGEIDEPVAICALKRYVADENPDVYALPIQKHTNSGKKIAIIGSGPAGLTAAYYLAISGQQVDIFDYTGKPGGMLRHGIPDFRLPPEVLDRELKALKELGINFHMGRRIDGELTDLKSDCYDAILLATGVSKSKELRIENSDIDGIYPGLEFLESAKLLREPPLEDQAIVIGGGNVAIDAAMSALRLGAQEVHIVCLESRDEMPAHGWEITQAEEEGIRIHTSWGPKRFLQQDDRVSGVELMKCTRVFDNQGRFDPQYNEDETKIIRADTVIVTIGQEVDSEFLGCIQDMKTGPGDVLKIDENFATGVEGVFAAGDVTRGPSSVVEAIADGRNAAGAIDKYVGGNGLFESAPEITDIDNPRLEGTAELFKSPRHKAKTADPEIRKKGFGLIEETYQQPEARLEAGRCLRCHLRQLITPVTLPPDPCISFSREALESVPEAEGVFQLLDEGKNVIRISGTANLWQSLMDCLGNPGEAVYLRWEEDPMYTKRESELIQQYLQEHGKLPPGNDMEDDLF